MLTVIKYIPSGTGWQALPNLLLQNYKLHAETVGILVECLSRPEDWINYHNQLLKRKGMKSGTLTRIFRELRELGYAYQVFIPGEGSIYIVTTFPLSTKEWEELYGSNKILSLRKFLGQEKTRAQIYNTDNSKQTDDHPTDDKLPSESSSSEQLDPPSPDKKRKKRKIENTNSAYKLAEYMSQAIVRYYPDWKQETEYTRQKWAKEFKRALEKDGRDYNKIIQVIDFVYSPHGWKKDHFSAGNIVRKFDALLEEARLKSKNYDSRERDPELTKLLVSCWGQLTSQIKSSSEKWEPSPEVYNQLIQIANNLCVAYRGSPVQDKWAWVTTFKHFLVEEYWNKKMIPRLNILIKPQIWENDFLMWKKMNNLL